VAYHSGRTRETNIDPEIVREVIKNNPDKIRKSRLPSRRGEELYKVHTPRSTPAKFQTRTAPPRKAPPPRLPDVPSPETIFVSYSRDDWDEFVEPLVIDLRNRGFKVWIDQQSIRRGIDWSDAIQEALDTCERMIVCVSPESMNSRQVRDEYRYFRDEGKTVLPLICREISMPYDLTRIQFVSYEERDLLIRELLTE
jgi:hypothetical protein